MSALIKLLKFKPVVSGGPVIKRLNTHRALVTAIPCRNKVSTPETIALISVMITSWMTVPAYILYNLKYYNGTVPRP